MATRHYRIHERFLVKLPLTVTSLQRSVSALGTTCDLGLGGTACELNVPLRLGEPVQLVLSLDVPRVMSGKVAWVAWAEGSAVRMGVRFSREDAGELSDILDTLGVLHANVGT